MWSIVTAIFEYIRIYTRAFSSTSYFIKGLVGGAITSSNMVQQLLTYLVHSKIIRSIHLGVIISILISILALKPLTT